MGFNLSSISFIFEAILLAFVLVAAMAWLSLPISRKIGLLDVPRSAPHKQHSRPTPMAGGLALVAGLLLSSWILGLFQSRSIAAIFFGSVLVFLFGLWDDLRVIPPLLKFIGQILAVFVLIWLGVRIQILESPEFFLGGSSVVYVYLDWFLTFLWVVGITNAFNFVDSMDGLAVGLAGMAAAFFMLVTLDSQQPSLSRLSALLLGSCIGIYIFNSPPAQLFLGDSGAQTLGFILAVLAIDYRPQGANQSSSWLVPILVLGIPIFDATLVVLSRLRRGRAVYAAARDHTYHRLITFGWNSNRAVLAMQIASLLLGCLAFVILTRPPLLANGIFSGILLLGVLAVAYLDSRKRWQ